jgi:TonB family protein
MMSFRGVHFVVTAGLVACSASVSRAADSQQLSDAIKRFEASHPGVLRVGGDVKPPRLVRKVEAQLPKPARMKFREFTPIILQAVISDVGDVVDLTIMKSDHPDLDANVLAAVRQWKYEPARRKGRPVAVFLTVTVLLEPAAA